MHPGPASDRGFTLIELMIVIAIIAIIAAIAIPNLIEARKASNEAAAIGFLKSVHTAQELFRQRDADKNGLADFALNLHLLRNAGLIEYTVAGPNAGAGGGYYFALFGTAGQEEWTWNGIAVPQSQGRSGDRSFATNQTGVIYFHTTAIDFQNPPDPTTWIPIGG